MKVNDKLKYICLDQWIINYVTVSSHLSLSLQIWGTKYKSFLKDDYVHTYLTLFLLFKYLPVVLSDLNPTDTCLTTVYQKDNAKGSMGELIQVLNKRQIKGSSMELHYTSSRSTQMIRHVDKWTKA